MKKPFRDLSLVIAFALLAAMIPLLRGGGTTAYAAGDFTIENGVLKAYNGAGGNVVIPSGVTEIAENAFGYNDDVKSVIIPEGVKKIGEDAFIYCDSLTSVVLPDSLKSIGDYAFYRCSELTGLNLPDGLTTIGSEAFENCSRITSLTIPESVTSVGAYAFCGWSGLTEVKIPSSLNTVSAGLFYDCTNLEKVTIAEGVREIGFRAFWNCEKLTSVRLPASLSKMGEEVFRSCGRLKRPDIAPGNQSFVFEDSVLYDKGKTRIIYCATNKSGKYDMPDTVRTIDPGVFRYCVNLTGVTIPYGVETIPYEAFYQCSGLTGVFIPDSVTWIEGSAFQCCSSLKSVTIPESVARLDGGAFEDCSMLESVTFLPKKVSVDPEEDEANCPFSGCPKLAEINYAGTSGEWMHSGIGFFFASSVRIRYGYSAPLFIGGQSGSRTITRGSRLTLSVNASGVGMKYQWYYMKDGEIVWNVWKGRTHAVETCTPNDTWDGIQLYCRITDSAGQSVNSRAVTINLSQPLAITEQPRNQTISKGSSVTVSVKATGSGLKYQWYYMKSSATGWSVWNGRTHASETCTPNDTWDGIRLYCKVTDSTGQSVSSGAATIRFSPIRITKQPANVTTKANKTVNLSVTAEGNSLSYQWYYRKKGAASFSVWTEYAKAAIQPPANNSWDGMQVKCLITDGSGNRLYTDTVTVTLVPYAADEFRITTQPKSVSIPKANVGTQSATFSVAVRNGNGLKYQWYYRKKGATEWSVWKNRTHACETVTPNPTWDGIQLYCRITDGNGEALYSDIARVTFAESPLAVTQQPKNVTVHSGDSATFTVKATGTGLKYQWYYRKKGVSDWSKWGTRTTASTTATANDTWQGMQVRCIVTDSSGSTVASSAATVTIAAELKITSQPTGKTVTAGNSVTLSLTATGTGLKYQWYFKKAGQTSFSVWNGRTHSSETVSPNATWNGIQLYCIVTDGAGKTVKSNTITVTVK